MLSVRRWRRERLFTRVADPLLAVVVSLNLLWPTSAPLVANGIPLNKSGEFLLASIFLGWLGLLLAFAVLRRLDPGAVPPQRFGWVDRCLTATALLLGIALLFVRVSAPPEETFTACYSTPEVPSVPCLFFADGWAPIAAGRVSQVSRIEEQLVFDASSGYGWRLGAFNDLAFNIYSLHPHDTRGARRHFFRLYAAHPFAATFAWDKRTGDRLARLYPSGARIQIAYRGEATLVMEAETRLLPFKRQERVEVIDLRPEELRSLRLRYANYSCPDITCQDDLKMKSLPWANAVFRVSLAPPGASADQAAPLTQRLLAQAEPPLSPLRLGPRVELAFLLVALARLAVWMGRLSLSRRPSTGVIGAAVLFAFVLVDLFQTGGVPDAFVAMSEIRLGSVPFAFVALPAFLGALGVMSAVLHMRASGYGFRVTVPGRFLLVSCALLAPLAVAGVVFTYLWLVSVASGHILGSLAIDQRSSVQFMSLSFVLMTLPVVLAAAGVLVAVVKQRSWAVGTITPVLLVLVSAGLLMQLPTLAAATPPVGPVSVREFFNTVGIDSTGWELQPRDDIELFAVGGDPLMFASLAKAVLQSPQRIVAPSMVLSKPFFMYLRAARYALFGDGEIYALALSRAVISWVIAVGGILTLARLGAARFALDSFSVRSRLRTGVLAVLAVLAWMSLSYGVLISPGFFPRLSEGPAMTVLLLSFGLLVWAIGRGPGLHLAAGALFGLSVFYRTPNLPLALLGLGIVCLGPSWGTSRWLRIASAYILPIAVAVLLIWLHAGAPLGMPPKVAAYAVDTVKPPQEDPDLIFQQLVPNVPALLLLGSALVAVLTALVIPSVTLTRKRVAALGFVVLCVLAALLPQRAIPYGYPRSLMTTYYAFAFVPMALLIRGFGLLPSQVAGDSGEAPKR